ncbi:uncharacterized protein LOC110183149 [Drosophila serrata]|uniref:uncharacterized protein LOC110183149 n=1 Tax=Drosophila serrata TaxID=7274 RepID=UPI000A1D04A9|nr:uncharacterized protein LOC110183149 [Drosophila serrata]
MKDNRNAELIAKLKVKEAESESLREVAEEANIKCQQYMDQKVKLTKEIEKLRTTLKAKEKSILTERERMSATISSLLEDKRNLEEKQCTLCERVDKLESQVSALKAININRFDSSIESTSPASVKLRTANNLDSKPIVKKSSINECAVRKEKRKTAHDEHRKQSCWNDSRDFGTMTDPEEGWVTAGNKEKMKNPLKAENKQLKFQLFKQQQKAATEQKRLRRKIHDLTTSIANTTDQTVDS